MLLNGCVLCLGERDPSEERAGARRLRGARVPGARQGLPPRAASGRRARAARGRGAPAADHEQPHGHARAQLRAARHDRRDGPEGLARAPGEPALRLLCQGMHTLLLVSSLLLFIRACLSLSLNTSTQTWTPLYVMLGSVDNSRAPKGRGDKP